MSKLFTKERAASPEGLAKIKEANENYTKTEDHKQKVNAGRMHTLQLMKLYSDPKEQLQHWIKYRVIEGNCWEWQMAKTKDGYGHCWGSKWDKLFGKGGAHQLAYIAFNGPITDGLVVMHGCDNPSCCNPEHLSLGTQTENIQDAFRKGRMNK